MLHVFSGMLLDELNTLNNIFKNLYCRANYTHNGEAKSLNFNIRNFKKFKDKIIYIILNEKPGILKAI